MVAQAKDEVEIVLGERYRDTTSGFEGVAVGRHEYLYGCTRITLQANKDGELKEYSFDAPALEEIEQDEAQITSRRTGGPRSTPSPRPTG